MAESQRKQAIAVLGTGTIGFPMARNLLAAGFEVRVWNRTHAKAEPLREHGARVADGPRQAAAGADTVITMLADGSAVAQVMVDGGVLGDLRERAVWCQMSTIGVEETERLADEARRCGVTYIDAPVLGTKQPAEQGEPASWTSSRAHRSRRPTRGSRARP